MSIEVVEGNEAQLDMEIELTDMLLKCRQLESWAEIKEQEAAAIRQQRQVYMHRVRELQRGLGVPVLQ